MEETPGETQERPETQNTKDGEKVNPFSSWKMDRYDIVFLLWISGIIAALTYLNPEGWYYVGVCVAVVAYATIKKWLHHYGTGSKGRR